MNTETEAIVVAHGLWLPGSETWMLRRRLAQHGYTPYLFRYRTVTQNLAQTASQLEDFVSQLPQARIHLVGYSLGGVVAVEMLSKTGNARMGRLVCLASPLAGSATGRALAKLPGGRALVGASINELNSRGGVGPWTGQFEIGVIAGTLGVGVGRLLGGLEGANDGTVAVEETRIEGLTAHLTRHVTHTSIMFSAQIADDVVRFLRTGAFV